MGADQQFYLCWNNFHTNITSAFESLRDDEDFVDITLACEGRQVKAHKMVLSACSPYFRSLLKDNPCQHPIVFLKDVTFANLASILDFMYHGEVNVSHNELTTFLKTAEALKVRGLAEDDKRKDLDGYVDASSLVPPRDLPDPGSGVSPRADKASVTDTRLSDSPPPPKKQRRRSGTSVQSAEDTNETVISDLRETSIKNEPQEFNDEDMLVELHHGVETDLGGGEESDDRSNFGGGGGGAGDLSESVTSSSRGQVAMQQLQESFGSFLPSMSQGSSGGFLSHSTTDMSRPPFPLEGVQGIEKLEGERLNSFIYVTSEEFVFKNYKRKQSGKMILRCIRGNCTVRGVLDQEGRVITQRGSHNHEADVQYVEKCKFLSHVRARVRREEGSVHSIFHDEAQRYQSSVLPPFSQVESTLMKIRNKYRPPRKKRNNFQ